MPLGSVSTKYRFCHLKDSPRGTLCLPLCSPTRFSKYPVFSSPTKRVQYVRQLAHGSCSLCTLCTEAAGFCLDEVSDWVLCTLCMEADDRCNQVTDKGQVCVYSAQLQLIATVREWATAVLCTLCTEAIGCCNQVAVKGKCSALDALHSSTC